MKFIALRSRPKIAAVMAAVLFTGVFHGGLRAQPAAFPEVPATLCFMSWENPVHGLFTTLDGEKFSEIHCPAYQFGRASRIKAGTPLQLYRQVKRDGKETYELSQTVPLPKDCLDFQAYVVREGDKDGAPSYRLVVMANDLKAFPSGNVRVFNFSAYPAMVRLGSDSYPLAPLEWKQTVATPDKKYRVMLITALKVGDKWIEGGREVMSLRPEYRGDVLIVRTKASVGAGLGAQTDARALTITTTSYVPEGKTASPPPGSLR